MATAQETQLAKDGLEAACRRIIGFDNEVLLRRNLGDALSFVAQEPVIANLKRLFGALLSCELSAIPYQFMSDARNFADQTSNIFNTIQAFDPANLGNNSFDARKQYAAQLESIWTESFRTVAPLISGAGTNVDATLEEIRRIVEKLRKQSEESDGIISAIRSASGKVGVSVHAEHFKDEADYHKQQGRYWLGASIVLAILVIWYANTLKLDVSLSSPWTVVLNLSHFVVIFLLTYGVVWTARMFAASRHNIVVNRHRMNALSSFETFVKSATDEQTRNAVLVQATQAIFSPQDSGFVKGEQVPYPGSQIVEILRGASGKTP